MPDQPNRVRVDGVSWTALLPFLLLFRAFRMAIRPTKLLLGLVLAILLYLGGLGLDALWGPRVLPQEIQTYQQNTVADYRVWLEERRQRTREREQLSPERVSERTGVFQSVLQVELESFSALMTSAASLDFGFDRVLTQGWGPDAGALGALGMMTFGVAGWLYHSHAGFMLIFALYAYVLTAIFGGAVARLAAIDVESPHRADLLASLRFSLSRIVWLISAPLLPLLGVLVVGVLMAIGGAVCFNFPVVDVIGALLFGLLLAGGLFMAIVLVLYAAASNLLYPAIAADGADGFDAVSRAYNYVMSRPWHYVFYTCVALVYGAIVYSFLTLLIYFALRLTHGFTGLLAVREVAEGAVRFESIFPTLDQGRLLTAPNWNDLDPTGKLAAALVSVWTRLLLLLLPAFAFSYYFSAQTWVYLLLRSAVDGTEIDRIHRDTDATLAEDVPDKVEPPTGTTAEQANADE